MNTGGIENFLKNGPAIGRVLGTVNLSVLSV